MPVVLRLSPFAPLSLAGPWLIEGRHLRERRINLDSASPASGYRPDRGGPKSIKDQQASFVSDKRGGWIVVAGLGRAA